MNSLNKLILLLLLLIVSAEGLRCPSCTYITTTADIPSLFRGAIDSVLNLFQENECTKPIKGPTPQIKEETCAAQPGKEARCSLYDGDLTLKVPLIKSEIPFKMYQRGCYYALPANVPSNGCHNRNSINEDKTFLKQIVDRTTSALSDWDVANFQGKLCLCSDTYCQTSGVSQGEIMYPLLFVVQLLALITYLF